jgi:hypothetical protein
LRHSNCLLVPSQQRDIQTASNNIALIQIKVGAPICK